MTFLIAASASYCIARCMDQGFADAMGLVTLRHGTDPVTWFKIHAFGAMPQLDKSCLIQDNSFTVANSCENYGFNFKPLWDAFIEKYKISDKINPSIRIISMKVSQYVLITYITKAIRKVSPILNFAYSTGPIQIVMKRVLMHSIPMLQKTIASYHLLQPSSKLTTLFKIATIPLLTFMTPTIKFRLHPNQIDDAFKETLIPGKFVYLTDQNISAANIGVIGSIKNSFHSAWPPILRAPVQVIKGACVLAVAGIVGYSAIILFPGFIAAHQTAIVAGALFALM